MWKLYLQHSSTGGPSVLESSEISLENGRASRFPRPELEISFSPLQPNRMALRRQGQDSAVTVKITRSTRKRKSEEMDKVRSNWTKVHLQLILLKRAMMHLTWMAINSNLNLCPSYNVVKFACFCQKKTCQRLSPQFFLFIATESAILDHNNQNLAISESGWMLWSVVWGGLGYFSIISARVETQARRYRNSTRQQIRKFHSGKASKGIEARRVGGTRWKRIRNISRELSDFYTFEI